MPIVNQKFESDQTMVFKTVEKLGRQPLYHVSASGMAFPNLKGKSGGEWLKVDFLIPIEIKKDGLDLITEPSLPKSGGYKHRIFKAKHWTSYAGLNSIFNDGRAVNSGHAVDSFGLVNPYNIVDQVTMKCQLAVRDTDAIIYRVAYKVELLVYFVGFGR